MVAQRRPPAPRNPTGLVDVSSRVEIARIEQTRDGKLTPHWAVDTSSNRTFIVQLGDARHEKFCTNGETSSSLHLQNVRELIPCRRP